MQPYRLAALVVPTLMAVVLACGGKTPAAPAHVPPPTTPGIVLTGVRVGVAGSASTTLEIGDKRQLVAQAIYSDASIVDVTNAALWQSSDPVVGPVSPSGVLSAAAEGAVDVKATYVNYSDTLHADIEKPRCHVSLDPDSLVLDAFSRSAVVTVTTSMSTCRWKAAADAAWLIVYNGDPGRSGNGTFGYSSTNNNNIEPRVGRIAVTVEGGPTTYHVVHQERPVSCVYQVSPELLRFNAAGGRGEFRVTTTPGDCQWRITDIWKSEIQLSATSGTGSATISYTVAPNLTTIDRPLFVSGLSGQNPPALHTVSVR